MTYIIGVQQLGLTAFVADSMTTMSATGERRFYNLKSGILYPGCIWAGSGNTRRGRNCLDRLAGEAKRGASLCDRWEELASAVARYPFVINDESEHFTLLFSTRHEGVPKTYELSSRTEQLLQVEQPIYTSGSGVCLPNLDEHVRKFIQIALSPDSVRAQLAHARGDGRPIPPEYWAYVIPFRLQQIQLGENRSAFDKAGVGGVFHLLLTLRGASPAAQILDALVLFNSVQDRH
jgi:hypothetical protein